MTIKKKGWRSWCVDWRMVTYAGAVLAVLFGIWKIDDRYLKAEDGTLLENRVVQTLEKWQDKMEYKALRDRMDTLKDQERKLKMQQRAAPNNKDVQEDMKDVVVEQRKIEDRLRELEKKK